MFRGVQEAAQAAWPASRSERCAGNAGALVRGRASRGLGAVRWAGSTVPHVVPARSAGGNWQRNLARGGHGDREERRPCQAHTQRPAAPRHLLARKRDEDSAQGQLEDAAKGPAPSQGGRSAGGRGREVPGRLPVSQRCHQRVRGYSEARPEGGPRDAAPRPALPWCGGRAAQRLRRHRVPVRADGRLKGAHAEHRVSAHAARGGPHSHGLAGGPAWADVYEPIPCPQGAPERGHRGRAAAARDLRLTAVQEAAESSL
mmetsp:Transcript_114460/g.318677  ORF Transcript_114460/g.318677 Transcript_114460/m.318677 type:complete len:258 (+) Transcript_114460:454-1227(+)